MADSKNALKFVVEGLNGLVKVLAEKLQDAEAKKEVLLALGLNPAGAASSPNIPPGTLDSINQYVGKNDQNADIEAFLSVVDDLINVFNAVDDFIHFVSDDDDPEIVTQFFDMLLQLYLMEAIRLRTKDTNGGKAFFVVIKTLNFYEELSTPSGGISHFSQNVGAFINRVFRSFDSEDEPQAALASETICILLAALSYGFAFVRDNLKLVFGFDPSRNSTSPNADKISERTLTLSFSPKVRDLAGNAITAKLILSFAVRPQDQQGGGIEALIAGGGKFQHKLGDWKFSFDLEGVPDVDVRAKVKIENEGDQPSYKLGDPQGTNLKIGPASFEINVTLADKDLDFKIKTKESSFALTKGKTDGFLSSILPDKGIYGNFDLGLGFSLQKNFYVDGGSGLSVLIPLHTAIGPLTLNSFFLKLTGNQSKDGVSVETSIGFTMSFLGFTASVERIGLVQDIARPESGQKNLGFVNYGISFKPPTGVGLALDTDLVKGGGFLYLDAERGQYFGALELEFKKLFTLKAVGVINTKMPDGSAGFSLLIIITTEFTPIQLGFGFTLIGVGGLLGLDRTANVEVLRQGIKTNTLNSILFPEDVVANMSRIISDIRQVFPPLIDKFLVGPMAKLGWGTPSIITLELGLLLEIPIPRIAILGVLKILLPEEDKALLRLQVNFLGIIDFDNKYISFDASLYDSRLITFTLAGDMAFRLSWGDRPLFILSVGGFHPAFKEAPGDLRNMTRLTISLLSGENPRITFQSYFAVTSNTVQNGSKVELYAEAAGFNVYGFLGYDLLFQFDPFRFVAAIGAGLALRLGSSVIMGIRLSGVLSGPTPWDARGEATFSILFFDISVGFHETWGDNPDAIPSEMEDLVQRLTGEINDNRNWNAEIPDNNNLHVSVKKVEQPADKLVIHPFGVLTFSERLVPLGVTIQKFGNRVPKDAALFNIKATDAGLATSAVTEQFAPANFFELTDSEKLARPSFERMPSGFKITGSSSLVVPTAVNKSVDYELTYLRKKRGLRLFAGVYKYAKALFRANLGAAAVAKSPLSFTKRRVSVNAPDAIQMQEDGYAVATTNDLKVYGNSSASGSYTEASQLLDQLVAKDPSLRGKVQIVAEHELNRNGMP